MSYPLSISKEEINKLPRYVFTGKIEVVDSDPGVLAAVKKLKQESVLGFDTETRPAFRKGERYDVSLLQLAGESTVYLFRLKKISNLGVLFELLADPKIVKTGVAIKDDVRGLKKLCSFKPENFVDLAIVAKEKKIINLGLRSLTAIVLGKRLSKKAKVSNWERDRLTAAQIKYAACDGAVGYALYQKFFDS